MARTCLLYTSSIRKRANDNNPWIGTFSGTRSEGYAFATYDELGVRFILKGAIPAQETLNASTTINPPFELSYWYFAMQIDVYKRQGPEDLGVGIIPHWQ